MNNDNRLHDISLFYNIINYSKNKKQTNPIDIQNITNINIKNRKVTDIITIIKPMKLNINRKIKIIKKFGCYPIYSY